MSIAVRSVPCRSACKNVCWASVPTPPQTTGLVGTANDLAIQAAALAQAFHLELLQPGTMPAQAIVVRQEAQARGLQDDRVPQRQQRKRCGQIRFERRIDRVPVHGMAARQKLVEAAPDRWTAWPADRSRSTPKTVRRPSPTGKLAARGQAEARRRIRFGRHDDHVPSERRTANPAASIQPRTASAFSSVSRVERLLLDTMTSVVAADPDRGNRRATA